MNLQSWLSILNPRAEIHTGVAAAPEGFRYAMVTRSRKGAVRILSLGDTRAAMWRASLPLAVHADLGMAPVALTHAPLDGVDAETWVARNEEKIVPPGFSSDAIVNEYAVEDGAIFSATIARETCAHATGRARSPGTELASLSVPLWDLAILYARSISGDFVIWKLDESGSVLGFVSGRRLRRLCNFWAGRPDVERDSAAATAGIAPLLKSLTDSTPGVPVVLYDDAQGMVAQSVQVEGIKMLPPPSIPDVPLRFHEAYALALHQETFLDFAPQEEVRVARERADQRGKVLKTVYATAVAAAAIVGLALVTATGMSLVQRSLARRLAPVAESLVTLKALTHERDSLRALCDNAAWFHGRESAIALFLSDLQTAFPEGAWVQEIGCTEASPLTWQVSLDVMALSTSLIPAVLRNLGQIPGAVDIRMAYSEQASAVVQGRKEKTVRARITGAWRFASSGAPAAAAVPSGSQGGSGEN